VSTSSSTPAFADPAARDGEKRESLREVRAELRGDVEIPLAGDERHRLGAIGGDDEHDSADLRCHRSLAAGDEESLATGDDLRERAVRVVVDEDGPAEDGRDRLAVGGIRPRDRERALDVVALADDGAPVIEVLPDGEDALGVEDDREPTDVDRAGAVDVLVCDDVGRVGEGGRRYAAALEAIDVRPGMSLLDVGCGSGLALELAYKRGATVSGLDASEGLLAVARDRLPGADLRHGDVEALPYEDDSFDAVTAFNSVQHASDPTAALREIKRVSKPGAPVAIATWGPAEQVEMRVVLGAIGSLLGPPPPGAGGPFALAAPGALEALAEGAGLTADQVIDVPTPFIYADLDTALRGNFSSGPGRMAIERAGEEAAKAALVDALAEFTMADGSIRLDNVFKVVIARA
jgi:SAM-dependent methyltransferase